MNRCFSIIALMLFPLVVRAEETISYDKEIKPLFRKHCQTCHNPDRPRGELDLSTYAATMLGGTSGKAIVAGKPNESLVYTLAAHTEEPKMPPNSPKIPQRELDLLKKWIETGAREKATSAVVAKSPSKGTDSLSNLAKLNPLPRASAIHAIALHPKQPLFAIPGRKQILLYELASGKFNGAIDYEHDIHALHFSHDGKWLLVGGGLGGQMGHVTGYEVGSWKQLFQIGDETDVVLTCDLSRDRSMLVFGGPTRVVKVVSVPEGKLLHTFRKPTDWVTSVKFSPDGLLVGAADRFGGLFLWEAKSGKEFAILRGHTKAITAIQFRNDGEQLASTSEDGTIRLWDLHTLSTTKSWMAHESGSLDLQIDSTGNLLSCGRDRFIRLWDATGKPIKQFGPTNDHTLQAKLTGDGKQLVIGDWSGLLQIGQFESGTLTEVKLPLATSSDRLAMVLPTKPRSLNVPKPSTIVDATKPTSDPIERAEQELREAKQALQLAQQSLQTAESQVQQNRATISALEKLVASRERAVAELKQSRQSNGNPAEFERSPALIATEEALNRLRSALATEPNNQALKQAIQETEKALQSLQEESKKK